MARNLAGVAEASNATRSQNLSKLSKLVKEWGEEKVVCDDLTKKVKDYAAQIKKIMIAENLEDSESGPYIAKLSFSHTENFDEGGMISFIKSVLWADKGSMECPYIKRVEVVDWDAIEKAMYNGDISKEHILEMDKFKSVTDTPVLKLAKVKEDD